METCLWGFSYVPEQVSVQSLVEESELERTWRSRRRQRAKEQEEKIWLEFVREKDVVEVVSQDDPYQFLQRLPEACIKELLDSELPKTKKDAEDQNRQEPESEYEAKEDLQIVTFVEETDREDGEMFHIYDDEHDAGKEEATGPTAISDNEDVAAGTRSSSPVTVRERDGTSDKDVGSGSNSPAHSVYESKPGKNETEIVSNVIQSSIHCEKVKDLRSKIHEEILSIINTMETQVLGVESEQAGRSRRCSEFSARFHRIHLYQLKRQMDALKRNTDKAPPFAQHTHYHAQMARVASLHLNLLQAFQVFHKWVRSAGAGPLGAAGGVLQALSHAARDVSRGAARVPPPRALQHAAAIYHDEMLESCDTLDESLCHHSHRFSDQLVAEDSTRTPTSKPKTKRASRSPRKADKIQAKTSKAMITESRLSMYSLDTLKLNLNGRSSARPPYSTSKNVLGATEKKGMASDKPKIPTPKRTPRSRGLRRAGGGRAARAAPDAEVSTLVEAVDMLSSHSRSASPRVTPRTPRGLQQDPRKGQSPKPRLRHTPQQLMKAPALLPPTPLPPTPRPARDGRRDFDKIDLCDGAKEVASARAQMLLKEGVEGEGSRSERDRRASKVGPACEVSRLLKQLCSGDSSAEISGAKNAQLHFVSATSPRPPSTPQLLKILETTIKKKPAGQAYASARHRLQLSAPRAADGWLLYRTRFVQHMLASALYANGALGKPWELLTSVADKLIEDVMMTCVKEMQIKDVLLKLYRAETK